MPSLTVRLLGPPQVSINEQPVKWSRPQAEAVFYRCFANGSPISDGELLDLFWLGQNKALQRLSEAIWHINDSVTKGLQQVGISSPPKVCVRDLRQRTVTFTWPFGDMQYDVELFEHLVKTTVDTPTETQAMQHLEQAYALYQRGPFLGTFTVQNAGPDWDNWIATTRSRLENHYLKLLQPLSIRHIAQGAWSVAIEHLQHLLQGTPEAEVVYGLLMVCYGATGDIPQAERVYQQYVAMMDDVLCSPTNDAMTQMHQIIRDGQLVPMQVRTFIERALQIKRHQMHAILQEALQAAFKAIGVTRQSAPGTGYHQVLHQAQMEARRRGDRFVGTPHLFLALCAMDSEGIRDIMDRLGVNLDAVVETVRMVLGETANENQRPTLDQTLPLRRVLRVAQECAEEVGADIADMPHLWVGLMKEKHGLLKQVLLRHGVDSAGVLQEIEQEMDAMS